AEPGQRAVEVIAPDVGDHDLHAMRGERLGLPERDAAAATRDERNFAGEIFHIGPLVDAKMPRTAARVSTHSARMPISREIDKAGALPQGAAPGRKTCNYEPR